MERDYERLAAGEKDASIETFGGLRGGFKLSQNLQRHHSFHVLEELRFAS